MHVRALSALLKTLRANGVAEYKETRYENGQPAEAIALLLPPAPVASLEKSAMEDADDDSDEKYENFLEKIDKANAPARKQ